MTDELAFLLRPELMIYVHEIVNHWLKLYVRRPRFELMELKTSGAC